MLLNRERLIQLAATADEPRISMYLPAARAGEAVRQGPIRLKNLLGLAERRLVEAGSSGQELLKPARRLLKDDLFWRFQEGGLALFLSPSGMLDFRLPYAVEELAVVGHRFHLRPLLPLLGGDSRFWILALSKKRTRLLQASLEDARELDAHDIPASLSDAVGFDWEQRSLQFFSATPRGASGQRDAVFHGHGAGKDDDAELDRFLRLVDDGVLELIEEREAPLVVAAVEEVFARYAALSRYPNLVQTPVRGNPDVSAASTLHAAAVELVRECLEGPQREAAASCEDLLGTGGASAELAMVLEAAVNGRVKTMFLARGATLRGRFDPEKAQVHLSEAAAGDCGEDLLDRAAAETLRNGGAVYSVPPDEVPGKRPVAAIFRY